MPRQSPPNRIAEWRRERGLTQEDLAEALGVNTRQVKHLENGTRRLTFEWLHRLAHVLEVATWDLTPLPDEPELREELELLARWRRLNRNAKEAIYQAADHLAKPASGFAENDSQTSPPTKKAG